MYEDYYLESEYEDRNGVYDEYYDNDVFDYEFDDEPNRCEADIKDGVCQYILNVNGKCMNVKNHIYDDELGEIEYFSPHNATRH